MPSKRAILSIILLAAVVCALGLLAWLSFFTPTQRNYRRAQSWLDQTVDMPYQDGFTLQTALRDVDKRLRGRNRSLKHVIIYVPPEGLERAKASFDSPIHYSYHGFPFGKSLTELLRPLGLGYYILADERGVCITITALADVADHERRK